MSVGIHHAEMDQEITGLPIGNGIGLLLVVGEVLFSGLGRRLGLDLQPAETGHVIVVFGGVQNALAEGVLQQSGNGLGCFRRREVFMQHLFVIDIGQLEGEFPALQEWTDLHFFVGSSAGLFELGQGGEHKTLVKKRLKPGEHKSISSCQMGQKTVVGTADRTAGKSSVLEGIIA